MKVVLISTYEMGRQPFGLASPAAWLRDRGHEVVCADLAVSAMPGAAVRAARLVAFYLPMHTATRLATRAIRNVRDLNPGAHLAAYGLYAPLNAEYLTALGVATIIGGEFESALAGLADSLAAGAVAPSSLTPLDRLNFIVPDRTGLPPLNRYATLVKGDDNVTTGYTEASRGCKHLCRHCPVVPVYQGAFRIVQPDIVLEDIRNQVQAGARHITFGDPDFFNGPKHGLAIVQDLAREFPGLTYDVTIKIEHLLKHRDTLPTLKNTGCLFVTSAVESLDDVVLEKLEKHHTRRDFTDTVELCRAAGLQLNPTFIAFMPWTTRAGYIDLLSTLRGMDLIDAVSPVQLALRLLIPSGSRLLALDEIRQLTGPFDAKALAWPWSHPDPSMDQLAKTALAAVGEAQKAGRYRADIFEILWKLATSQAVAFAPPLTSRSAIPYLNEPWYC